MVDFERVRERFAARSLVAVAQLVALATVSKFSLPRGFPLDDAWIHQVVARTFAESGVFGFDPSLPGSGATSWLWPALLALNPALLHVAPPIFTATLAGILYLGVGQLVHAISRDDGMTDGPERLGLSLSE